MADNPLLAYFVRNGGNIIHKWVDYFEVYHRFFARYRGQPITFLEIGVQNGGSTRMWRDYFGPEAHIIGVDIDPACTALSEEGFEIWIGDQADPEFWRGFLAEHPQLDVVLDDGGHTMAQQIATFEALFPALSEGGTFLCEDTHTSYVPSFGGGLGADGTFLEYVKNLIDEMHGWYHDASDEPGPDSRARQLYSLSIFDSMVAIEKRRRNPPMTLAFGYGGHVETPRQMDYRAVRAWAEVPPVKQDAGGKRRRWRG